MTKMSTAWSRRELVGGFSIEIDDEAAEGVEDDSLVLHVPGRTVWCECIATDVDRDAAIGDAIARHGDRALARFDERDERTTRVAFLMPRSDQPEHAWGLLAFVAVEGQCLLLGYYFDDAADVAWALTSFRSAASAETSLHSIHEPLRRGTDESSTA